MAPRPIRANTLFYGDNLPILREYSKLQILTIEQLLNGAAVEMPPEYGAFKQAQRVE